MVERLSDELEFYIVTSDRDMHDAQPYTDVNVNSWNMVGKAQVFYSSPARCCLGSFTKLIRETPHDLLYLNSFFDSVFTLKPLLSRRLGFLPNCPTVLAPRGEFSEGALNIKSWKKVPYLKVARLFDLYQDLIWHSSSEYESADIERVIGTPVAQKIVVARDLSPSIEAPNLHPIERKIRKGVLRVCFLSRISPKKNLDFALRVLAKVSVPIAFNIFGPIDDVKYWGECQALISRLPPNIEVHSLGGVEHSEVALIMREHDLFFKEDLK